MIAKPFIDRLKSKSNKSTFSKTDEQEKLLTLFQLINKISSNENEIEKLVEVIFRVFKPASILISTHVNESLSIDKTWQNPELATTGAATDILKKPASSLCEQVKRSKQTQYQDNIPQTVINDPLLQKLNTYTFIGFPVFDENNNVMEVISLIHTAPAFYSQLEINLLNSITGRMGRALQQQKTLAATETPQPAKNTCDSQLQADLDATNKSLESLSYAISHDLRAPLRSMDSFSQLLAEDFANVLPEEGLNYLSRIRRSAKRMGSMIDELLGLSRVTRRKLEKQEMNLGKTANVVLNEILEKHSEYKCKFSTEPNLIITADKHLIKIALQQLLDNACKFSREQDEPVVSLSHFEKDGETVYKISDNGCGFDMTYYDQLFEPFKKLHTDNYFEGTGIGLTTAKRVIQRHNGKIWVESEPDEGTNVFFTLGTP